MYIEPGKYLHTKSGKHYEVLGTALETETQEQMVVYRPLYKRPNGHTMFVRPYDMFIEDVIIDGKKVPRFQKTDA